VFCGFLVVPVFPAPTSDVSASTLDSILITPTQPVTFHCLFKLKLLSKMTAPSTIKQRFLSKPNELGVVAVGFNGGQV